jgi:hypothetical protein
MHALTRVAHEAGDKGLPAITIGTGRWLKLNQLF